MERTRGYKFVVYTKELTDNFKGPKFWRNFVSSLSESPNSVIGNSWPGMSLEEAEEIAAGENVESYIDGNGKLRSAKGVIVRIS